MYKFTLASRATREFITLIKRGKLRDDVDNYPAIKELMEENTHFPELAESLSSLYDFYHITSEQRDAGRRKMEGELYRRKRIRRRRTIAYAASVAGAAVLISALYVANDNKDRHGVISYYAPDEKFAAPQIILSSGERVDLAESETIDDHGHLIDNHDNQLVYGQDDAVATLLLHKILTPEKSRYTVLLSDGSEVVVNANSEIEYPVSFGNGERRVSLRGEAFFRVSKDTRPFIVECSGVEFEVFGTSFNVNGHNKDHVTAVLVSGSIGVKREGAGHTMVSPRQAAVVDTHGESCQVYDVDVEHYTGWMRNTFSYDNVPLRILLNDMASWYGIEFRYDRRMIEDLNVTVQMDRGQDYKKIMNNLSTLLNINFRRKEGQVYEIVAM